MFNFCFAICDISTLGWKSWYNIFSVDVLKIFIYKKLSSTSWVKLCNLFIDFSVICTRLQDAIFALFTCSSSSQRNAKTWLTYLLTKNPPPSTEAQLFPFSQLCKRFLVNNLVFVLVVEKRASSVKQFGLWLQRLNHYINLILFWSN